MGGHAAPGSNAPPPGRAARSPRRLIALLLVCVGCVLLALVVYAPVARRLTRDRGEHLTVEAARDRVRLDLPAGASDVRFYQHTRPDELVFVDFTIDEAGFLDWATRQGWKTERVREPVSVWPRLGFGDRATVVAITDGLTFRNNPGRAAPNTVVVNYDRVRRRAYYGFWSEPRAGEG